MGIASGVSFRRFFAILIVAAMLFAPFAMQSAMAPAPANHHAQMQANDHCDGQPAQDQDNNSSADKPCCAAMCIAVAIAPASVIEPLEFDRTAERPALAGSPNSYLAKLPTPPPRVA
jgi:hypothetical protein